jgi:hypothetical protein
MAEIGVPDNSQRKYLGIFVWVDTEPQTDARSFLCHNKHLNLTVRMGLNVTRRLVTVLG